MKRIMKMMDLSDIAPTLTWIILLAVVYPLLFTLIIFSVFYAPLNMDILKILLILVVIIPAVIYPFVIIRTRRKFREILQRIASMVNGEVESRWGKSTLHFNYLDMEITIDLAESDTIYLIPETKITAQHNLNLKHWLFIRRKISFTRSSKMSQDFDQSYVVKGSDEKAMRQLLDREIQQSLMGIYHLSPYIEIQRNKVAMRFPKILKTEEDYKKVIDTLKLILDKLRETPLLAL